MVRFVALATAVGDELQPFHVLTKARSMGVSMQSVFCRRDRLLNQPGEHVDKAFLL